MDNNSFDFRKSTKAIKELNGWNRDKELEELEKRKKNDPNFETVEEFDDKIIFHLKSNDPSDCGRKLFRKLDLEFEKGITVFVGCNGAGKTTLIRYLTQTLDRNLIEFYEWSDTKDGRSKGMSRASFYDDLSGLAARMVSSEGENIIINVIDLIKNINQFIKESEQKNIYIFLDGIDSGLSVDKIINIKEDFLHFIQEVYKDKNFFIFVTANQFELARGEKCFDTKSGKFIEFKTYESFKKFVLKSNAIKEKELDRLENKR